MSRPAWILRFALSFALAGSLSFAVAQDVRTDYDHDANFQQYHTFSVYRVHASDGIVEKRLRSNIVASLTERGFREVPQGGDLAVTAIGGVRNRQEYTTFYNGFGPGWGYGGWGGWYGWGRWGGGGPATTTVYNIPVGTLAVDVYDARTHQLIFRGTAVDDLSKNPDKNAKKGEKAVDKIFDKMPDVHKVR
ncbi:DUF4136 domain-containing protein [Terriglobus roseus]|uniref:DUF4136 domain-containing protein n=1 Tax=Terriglobus roseus TaxID=392734 RepID=A0A1G7J031_9BACT|nr:DUF4136 domain-containing protein [Terriglobus roseus]SDF18290.1 protein of unknown function [Terriglobus roseus]